MDVSGVSLAAADEPMGEFEDQVSSRLPGNRAAATGTSGKLIVGPQDPSDTGPRRLISAALLHGPRLPASVIAVSRTYRARTAVKVAVFSVLVSGQVPLATALQVVPSELTPIE